MAKFTEKRKLFVKEYLKDLNGSKAAIRAGYSENTSRQIAYSLLADEQVQEAISKAFEKRSKKLELDAEWVLKRLVEVNDRCLQKEAIKTYDANEGKMIESGEWKFEHSGANKSLELIGRNLGMFTDKVEHSGEMTTIIKDDVNE